MPFDIQTVLLGTDFVVGPALLTLGVGYGWGKEPSQELVDVGGNGSECDLETGVGCPHFVYRNFKALFGFEIGV